MAFASKQEDQSKQGDRSEQSYVDCKIDAVHSVAVADNDDDATNHKSNSLMQHSQSIQSGGGGISSKFSSSSSVDERIRDLIDAVEGWAG